MGWVFYGQLKSIFSLTVISCVAKHKQRCKTISKIQLHSKQTQPKDMTFVNKSVLETFYPKRKNIIDIIFIAFYISNKE